MLIADLEHPNMALLGAGRESRSVWRQLRGRFPRKPLTIYSETPVDAAFAGDFRSAHDTLAIGPFAEAGLEDHEILVRSPGVSPYRDSLAKARAAGVRFTTATSLWFAEHPAARTICITGTKGKSTTSALTAHLLAEAGRRVQLAGNIGQPLLDCADTAVEWWVIELSSYQLVDLEARPTIGAILNLSDAHLEWHGGRAAYQRDKLRLADLAAGPLAANHEDPLLRELLAGRRGVSWFGAAAGFHVRNGAVHERTGRKVAVPPPELPGRHNLLNLCAALSLADMVGVRHPDLPGALGSFRGLPHRLQRLGRRGGLAFYDDSMATTPVATLAALEALSGRRITLIFGGQRQDIDWTKPIEQLRGRNLHAMIAIPDSGPEIAALARSKGVRPVAGIHATGGLAEAVRLATELSAPGGTVLLSPGAPSFPRFRDFADRGDQFAGLAGFARDDDNGRPGRGQKEEIAGQG